MSTTLLKVHSGKSVLCTPDAAYSGPEGTVETLVVGIGVAPDGLDSLVSLFGNLSLNQKIVYVVVPYSQLHCPGNVLDYLARHTALQAELATHGVRVQPNHIYLLPPHSSMRLEGGRLLEKQGTYAGLRHPVDDFFISLAEEMREKSIAVVLAGTGTDGIRGVRAVRGMGGLTIARAPDSTRFCGEAQGAMTARLCDMALSPGMISAEIISYLKHTEKTAQSADGTCDEDELLAQLYILLKKVSTIDFTYYKKDTVRRRISRRMALQHRESLQAYVTSLLENREEACALGKDILIGSTSFFRDSSCFMAFKEKVVATLLERAKPGDPIRVWVAGCSTGEEAYSVAMLFDECMRESGRQQSVEIFATDIDPEAIKTASRGVYHESIAADICPERLNRYFTRKGTHYTVCKAIRRLCVFATHNLFINPPFRNLDLIVYRNVHIYLQPILQSVILSAFHSVLKADGFLFMGRSESVGEHSDVFVPLSMADKLFRHALSSRRQSLGTVLPLPSPPALPDRGGEVTLSCERAQHAQGLSEHNLRLSLEEAFPQVLETLRTSCVLLSDQDDIEHLSGDFQGILQLPRGAASRSLFAMLTPELVLPVTTALHRARLQAQPVSFSDVRRADGCACTLTAIPLKNSKGVALLALLFTPSECGVLPLETVQRYNADVAARQRIAELEQEVRTLRETLDDNLAELKVLNQELQASNQEMHISNEELQTSNEELQSVNEELHIVNSEYQLKLAELTELNDDMSNFLNSTMIGLLLVDSNLNVRKFTDYVAREFGIMAHDIGRSMLHVVKGFANINIAEITTRVLQRLTPIQCEARSESGKHYMLRVSPYRTVENKINGLVISIVDIEELKGAYSQIEKLSYAIEQMPNIVVLTDPQGLVEYVNPRFSAVTGYSAEEMRGKSLRDCLPSLSDEAYAAIWAKLQRQEIWTAEVECGKKNGEAYWERIALLPVVNKEAHITNYLKLAEDITAQKLTQLSEAEYRQHLEKMVSLRTADLEESRNEAQAASTAKTEFLSTMSHEIRTPMNAIIGFTHIFDRANLSPVQLAHLDKIQLSANTLLGIINDVLDIAKIESGKLELSSSPFDLRRAVETVCSIVEAAALTKGLKLRVTVDDAVPDALLGDVLRVNQILLNLLNNAIKFTERGEVSLNVQLSRSPDAEFPDVELAFAVQDTGIGIAEAQLPRLFQSFMQADSSISRKYGGTGLGLAICRRLVERMNGQISVQSRLGEGTCFEFTLRLPPASAAQFAPTRSAPTDGAGRVSLHGRRVLVVEDNEINQEIACGLLEEYKLEIHRAMNGREAVNLAMHQRYDCIFMDMQMPVMDGIEATRQLRALGAAPELSWLAEVPIIAMTANALSEDRQHCLQAGMNAHMAKPIEPDILRSMLCTWIVNRTDGC